MTFSWWHLLLALIPVIPSTWAIWHIWAHDFNGDMVRRNLWLCLAVFVPAIGGLIYLAFGSRRAGQRFRRRAG